MPLAYHFRDQDLYHLQRLTSPPSSPTARRPSKPVLAITYDQITAELGITAAGGRVIEKRALAKLRAVAEAAGLAPG
jgi:hypothetical protein